MKRMILVFATEACLGTLHAASPVQTWKVNPANLRFLAPAVTQDGFRIQPPLGYSPVKAPAYPGTRFYAWAGAVRADGTRPYLQVSIATVPNATEPPPPLETLLEKFLSAVRRKRTQWTQSTFESGLISDQPFLRSYWDAVMPGINRPIHGFNYIAIYQNQVVAISSQDVEPYYQDSLAIAESSTFTFAFVP